MLRLSVAKTEPFWLEIIPAHKIRSGKAIVEVPAQRTQFRPITMAMILAARTESGLAVAATAQELVARVEAAKDEASPVTKPAGPATRLGPSMAQASGEMAFSRTIAQLGIVAWEGIGDAQGDAVEPTPENIDAYMANWRVFDAIDRLYINPALTRLDEKNASSPPRNGTSGARTRAKGSAGTARKPARSAPTS